MRTKRYRRRSRRRALLWLVVIAAVLAGGWHWFQWQCYGIQTTVTQVELSGLPAEFDGFRIAHLSDFHGYEFGANNEELLRKVAEQQPDLIVITGDIIDHKSQFGMITPLAKGLCAIAPTYYVTGNHEWSLGTDTVKDLKRLLINTMQFTS